MRSTNLNTQVTTLPTACHGFRHTCEAENAPRFADWILNRGGLAVWLSADLSDPAKSWTGPVRDPQGVYNTKPHWQAQSEPVVITDPSEVGVCESKEVNRFRVAIRTGAQGFTLKVSDGGSRRIRAAVAKAGDGAFHTFDYGTQEAVIFAPTGPLISLAEWIRKHKEG